MGGKGSKTAGTIAINEISCLLNGKTVSVPEGTTVYQASLKVLPMHQRIPTLCYHPYLEPDENCNICKVEIDGTLMNACTAIVEEGMSVKTVTPEVNDNIKLVLKNMLSTHPLECPTCIANTNCTFQDLLAKYDVSPKNLTEEEKQKYLESHHEVFNELVDYFGNFAVDLNPSKCILCQRCVRVCESVQNIGVLGVDENGEMLANFQEGASLGDTLCISCGQCTFVCPTSAIALRSSIPDMMRLFKKKESQNPNDPKDDDIVLVAQTAPAVRVTVSEDLGLEPGDVTEYQMVEGMKLLGFDHVFDTNFTADLTIIEEGHELIQRVTEGGPFPMFTSCCPAWINLCETQYPEFLDNLSTCKSPQQMMGSLVKDYWADVVGIDKSKLRTVSIMPCTAKKDECERMQMEGDVDYVLTTRELAHLFKIKKINVPSLEGELYDDPLGASTGASVIFGATGGVMEAALRTAYEVIVGKPLDDINFLPARGLEGIKEATVDVGGLDLNIAIAHTAGQMQKVLESIKNGEKDYHFVEFMCCPGGCIGGGGNPKVKVDEHHLTKRMQAIYNLDENNPLRKSHENESVNKLYEVFLEKPLGHQSHKLLHTKYTDRSKK